jgi:hypothetical protein
MQPLTCYNHPDTPATATCADCGAPICAACIRLLRDQPFCPADYAIMRREPAGAHLPVDVPAYQPLQFRQVQPANIASAPLSLGSLLGSELVTVAGTPIISALRQPHLNDSLDTIAKWAWVGFICTVLADIGGILILFGQMRLIQNALFAIPALALIGLIINITTMALCNRSIRSAGIGTHGAVGTIGCIGLCANILTLSATLFVFWVSSFMDL